MGIKDLKNNFRVNPYFNKFDPKKCIKSYTIRDNLGIKANLKIEANFEMKKLGNLSFYGWEPRIFWCQNGQ